MKKTATQRYFEVGRDRSWKHDHFPIPLASDGRVSLRKACPVEECDVLTFRGTHSLSDSQTLFLIDHLLTRGFSSYTEGNGEVASIHNDATWCTVRLFHPLLHAPPNDALAWEWRILSKEASELRDLLLVARKESADQKPTEATYDVQGNFVCDMSPDGPASQEILRLKMREFDIWRRRYDRLS